MDAQLKRGVLSICILQMLYKEDRYGYDIVKKMQNFFPETEESTIYAILRRLHNEGLTSSYDSDISLGPKRKYYTITDKGKSYLDEQIQSWCKIGQVFKELEILPSNYIN